jgi:predicted transcriptional regulator
MAMDEEAKRKYAEDLAAELAKQSIREDELRAAMRAEFEVSVANGDVVTADQIRAKFSSLLFEDSLVTLSRLLNAEKESVALGAAKYVNDVLLQHVGVSDPTEGLKKLLEAVSK